LQSIIIQRIKSKSQSNRTKGTWRKGCLQKLWDITWKLSCPTSKIIEKIWWKQTT